MLSASSRQKVSIGYLNNEAWPGCNEAILTEVALLWTINAIKPIGILGRRGF